MEISNIINELGEERELYFNAIAPPIVPSSNFGFESVDAIRNAFKEESSAYLYSRGKNPTGEILEKKLAALDGAEAALAFNSGAAAIYAGITAFVKAGDHIISVKNPYSWAQHLFDIILSRFGVSTTYVEGKSSTDFEEALKPSTSLIYLESPNSWNFAIQPLAEVAAFAKKNNIITFIDNSYCTPLYQRPIDLGIDLCMQTATKYIGGHSDTLGGVLTGSKNLIKKIYESEYSAIGSGIQAFNAWLLLRGLRTLQIRLEKSSATTKQVVEWLKQHPKIEEVLFPFDEDFQQYQLAKQQMKGCCGLFTIILKNKNREAIETFCNELKHFSIAVSWGGYESLVLPKCATIAVEEFDPTQKEHLFIRMYVGLEEPNYLINDLQQALATI